MNNFLTIKLFRNEDTIQAALKEFLNSKTDDFYVYAITKLVNRWRKNMELNIIFERNNVSKVSFQKTTSHMHQHNTIPDLIIINYL
ncbi:hypothetical protein WH47_10518 [Habropoda laboriosa]|uniref:Histone-lysine N-methyltransferase SETMAR n=1 Tax=Habropoda laboriosa TaxID=597456 RepID=A0A0L7R9M1_9HYME|nr:hypothetical protein WH47_10518 [Habropoda laboriosa]